MKKITFLITLLASQFSFAQTGPGGVGTSTNNLIWLDASTLSTPDGVTVNNWVDKSGNASNAIQNSASLKPIMRANEVNGFPAIDFDGANDHMRSGAIAGFNSETTVSYFFVLKPDVVTQQSSPFTNAFTGSNSQKRLHGLINTTAGAIFSFCRNTGGTIQQGPLTNSATYSIHSSIITGTDITSYTNAANVGSTSGTMMTSSTHAYYQIGRRPTLNDLPYAGNMAELIAFDDALNSIQRVLVENYLSSKYAIAINGADDHYALEGSGHYYNVTGIGMEGGNAVTDAEGRSKVRISNASALANGDYLLWGHNNATLISNNTDVPASFLLFGGARLNRTWRADETGDVGTYDLVVNFTGLPSPDPVNTVILIDDDGVFANGGTTIHSAGYSFNAGLNEATWTGVDIPDGYYFTVATVPVIYSITTGAWNDVNTWSCTCIPAFDDDVLITDGDTVTVDDLSFVNNLTLETNSSINFSGGNQLQIFGSFDCLGLFDGTGGSLSMMGSSPQVMNSTIDVILESFEVNNAAGVTLGSGNYNMISTGTYFPTDGALDVGTSNFAFLSDGSSSARIDEFNSGSSIVGSVIFNRFISSGTGGYRDLAVPLVGGLNVTHFDDDMYISGQVGGGFNDGCASSGSSCFASFKFYVANTYTDISNTSTVIPNATRGVHAWVSDAYPNGLNAPVSIDLTGPVNGDGSIVASASSANTFTLIGNPYISQIDFDELALSNIGDFYYVWDVNVNNYNWYQTANGASPLTEVIASGQGFVVMPETGFGTVTFTQSVKTSASAVFIRNATNNDFFRLALSNPNNKYACDVTFNVSEEADNKFDRFDVPTPYGLDTDAVYISAKVDERIVRCFGMNNRDQSLSVPIMINVPDKGYYTLDSRNLELFDKYTCVVLEDLETGSRYDLRNTSQVRFFIEKTKSEEARFILHFSNDACSQFVAGIDINTDDASVEINNFNDYVKVDMNFASQENVSISFFNMLGQNVLTEQHQNVNEKSVKINVPENLKNGVYLIVVETDKKRYTRKYNF